MIRFEGATATLRNCTIRNSRMHGLKLLASDPLLDHCQFLNNGSTNKDAFAIAMRVDSLPQLKNNTATGNMHDAIVVFDYHFVRNGTWLKDNLPYTLLDDVYVDGGKKLTLEPGVIVQFQNPYATFFVDGTLVARGTSTAPIVFTSDNVQKAPGLWDALIFRASNTNSILENCIIECGAAAGYSDEMIRFEGATATLRNCTIRNSRMHGMTFLGSNPIIEDCQFLNNGSTNANAFAMAMRTDSWPRLWNNTATGNRNDAISVFDYHVGRSGTWLKDNLPYTLVNDVYVDGGATLTLEPGLLVQFQNPDTALIVDGTLIARGAVSAPIRFTSDDVQKAPGQWEAIVFRASNINSILENCLVEYGAAAGLSDENIRFENATATIRNCTIRNSRLDGIRFQASDPVIENCQFVNNGATNGGFAMAMRVDSLPKLKNNLALGNGRDAIKVFEFNFGRNGTWVKDNLPYTLVNDVYVNGGKTLTLDAGVTVQFQDPNAGLWVDGVLIARGTAAAPINFTSDKAVKKPGQWRALTFRAPDGNSILENCTIEFGGANAEGNVALFGSSPRLNNCAIRNSVSDGLHCNNSASLITACRIINNGRDGVRTVNGASPVINNSTMAGQAEFGVRNFDTARIINAKSNYWGDPSGPLDNTNTDGRNQLNPSGKGDKVSEYVDWSSFLQTDPIAPRLAQKIEVAPASMDFGNVIVGQSQEMFLAVRNAGGLELTVTSIASDSSRFRVVSPALPFTVAPGLQQAISVTFSADATSSATGTLTLKSTDAGQPSVSVSLKANGLVASECLAAPSGLVGWWPGDGSFLNLAGTNHGQPLGGVTFSSGKVGQAFSFANDSDRITIPHDPLLDVQAPGFAVEFWMRGSKNQPHDQYLVVDKSHGWADSSGWMCQGFSSNGKLYFGIGAGGGGIVNFPGVTSTTDLLDGLFHHVAGTWDGSTVRLYVDSVLQGEAAHSAPVNNTRPVNLGYSWGGGSPNRFFRGQVDELSIYRRALTTNEIQAVVASGRAGKCKQASAAPVLALSPTSLDYSGVALGQTKDLTFTIRNSGNATLLLNSIVSDNPRFTVLASATPFNVANGAEQVVLVLFTPTDLEPQGGLVTINSNDPIRPKVAVKVSGNGFAPPPGNCAVVPAGLVSWWPGEGNATDVRTNHSGTIHGATFAVGKVGQAFRFNGVDDYVDLGNWNPGSAWTVEAWVNPSSIPPSLPNSRRTIAGGVSDCLDWGIAMQEGVFGVVIRQPGGCTDTIRSPIPAVTNTWYHIAGTCDGVTATIYVNGEKKGSGPVERGYLGTLSGTRIGGEVCCGGNNFPGLIDEVSIYSRALSETEIQTIFTAGSAGKCQKAAPGGLIAYLPFNGNAIDESGNGHNGIVTGATLTSDRFGQPNRAYQFDGASQFVALTGTTNLNFTSGGFTLSAWVSYDSVPGEGMIVAKHYGGSWNGFFLQISGNAPAFFLNGEPRLVSGQTANDGTWHHLVGVFDGTTQLLYLDGGLKGSRAMPYTVPNAASIEIGRATVASYFKGKIDDVRVYSRPLSVAEVTVLYASESGAAPQASVSPASLNFGSVVLGQTKDLAFAVRNSGAGALTVNSITSDNARFAVISPAIPFNVSTGAQQVVLVRFTPSAVGNVSGTLSVGSNDPAQAVVTVSATGIGPVTPPGTVLFSDRFYRADADRCALGQADLALGGSGKHFYLPLFPTGGTDASRPIGASIVSGALQNNGLDYGGIQFAASDGACANRGVRGQNLGQDLNIEMDLQVLSDAAGDISQAGPYLRSRLAPAGDGIIGGADVDPSGGYWVQLHSTGEVKVKRLNSGATVAFTGRPVLFNANIFHALEIAAQGDNLQVALDGRLQTFNQDGKLSTTVTIPNTGLGNQGAAGLAFGAEDNRGKIGGQRADNLIVSPFSSLSGLPVQNNFAQVRALVLNVRLDGQNNVLVLWPADTGKVRIDMTSSLSPPIQWTVLTNQPVVANGQNTITVPGALRGLAALFFRGVLEGAIPTPADGGGNAASPLAVAAGSISEALNGLNQIPITGTPQDFQARVNQQLSLLQNAASMFDASLARIVAQADAAMAALLKSPLLNAIPSDPNSGGVSLAGYLGKSNPASGSSPFADIINQYKEIKEAVDDLKLSEKLKDGSDVLNLITQNKSLEEVLAERSDFIKQISAVFNKMRDDVEAPLGEIINGKNRGLDEDVRDFGWILDFVQKNDARLGELMAAPGFTLDSYRRLNLTDKQKNLVAQAFRSSTLRGRLYLRDNLVGFLKTVASAGVETYVNFIIDAAGKAGEVAGQVITAAEYAQKIYDFLTQGASVPQTTLKFASRRRFLRTDDGLSDVTADLFLLAKLPDGSTRLATFLVKGKDVINERGDTLLYGKDLFNERGDILRVGGLQVPALSYDVLVVPRDQENEPIKLLPSATTVNTTVTTFVDLPLVYATKVTLNLGAKQRNSSGGLTAAALTYDQAKSLTVRVDGFPQAADGPMGGVFDSEIRPDGTTRGFFVIPFLPPDRPLKLNITGTPIEDFAEAFTVTSAQSERPVTLVLKAPPPVSVSVYVPTISWRLRNYADNTVIATGSGSNFTKTVAATVFNSRGPNVVSNTISGTLVAPAVSLGQPFDLTCTLTRGVQSAIVGLSSSSDISLATAAGTQSVSSLVVPTNPASISETLSFRPMATAGGLYKIDLTGAPGFTGGGPLRTFITADTFGGFSGNFSMSGDNSGIATGNGKVTITGNVYVGSELSTSNPRYRLDVTVVYQWQ